MTSQEYEQAVAAFYEAIGEPIGVATVTWDERLNSKSGKPYQVDVLIETSNGLQPIKTAVECKNRSKKVGRETVAAFATTVEDIGVEKGVIVYRSGFTKGAIALAEQKNINLVEMWVPIKAINISINMVMPEFSDIAVIQDGPQTGPSSVLTGNGDEMFITEPGQPAITLAQLLNNHANADSPASLDFTEMEIRFPEGAIISFTTNEHTAKVDGFRYKVRFLTAHAEKSIALEGAEAARYIVNEIFEGCRFAFAEDGQVREI